MRDERGISRRSLLAGAGAVGAVAALAALAAPDRLLRMAGLGPDPFIPAAPAGRVRLEHVESSARGQQVGFFTAVPAGHGDGAGLPVCLVLHGATATTADYAGYGLGRFVTAAVRQGAAPFVLAGADGGRLSWEAGHAAGDDPQRMLLDEVPSWLRERGFDADRLAAWGWSMGGYGALRLAEARPGFLRGVAAFSPAVREGDAVFADVEALAGTPLGIWCGDDDPFVEDVRRLVEALPARPETVTYGDGGHGRVYWNQHTVAALTLLAGHLSPMG